LTSLGLLFAILATTFSCTRPFGNMFLVTSSPLQTYTVKLTGQKERPRFFTVEVRFDAYRQGSPIWMNQYLHSGDWMDISFELAYPDHHWRSENILHFYREENFRNRDRGPTVATLINDTDQVIEYLKLESEDIFLIFDLHPHSKAVLEISPPMSDVQGIGIEGKFSNGETFQKGAGFDVKDKRKVPLTYTISLNDNDISIASSFLYSP